MLNITFVYPDFENLGVEYLISVCKSGGFNVKFVFYYAEDPYTKLKNFSVDYAKIADNVIKANPDVVVFSCVTDNYLHQLNCAKEVKKRLPSVITIFGGIHVTAAWRNVLRNSCVDCVSIGEGEVSLPEFLFKYIEKGSFSLPESPIKGLVFKKDGKIIGDGEMGLTTELDAIPFPAKEIFYSGMGFYPKEYYIITGRGCPYKCNYCYNSIFDKQPLRRRSVENVISELVWAKDSFKIKYVHFCDDSFTSNIEWLRDFCEAYKNKVKLPFLCSANPLLINNDVVNYLKDAGCVDVQIGVQSLSETICKHVLNRPTNEKKVEEAIRLIKDAGMMVQVDHMLGIPDDTIEEQEKAVMFYNKVRPNVVSVFWLTYYPGTKIIEIAKRKGLLTEEEIDKIYDGKKVTEGDMHMGGSLKNPEQFLAIAFLLNYLPILPQWFVSLLLSKGLYKFFKIKSYFLSTVVVRVILSIFDKRYFTGRGHILRFIKRFFQSRNRALIFKFFC